MENANSLYQDMAARTGGDIYLGVVGPVRTGKSTFIKRFMDTLVIPHMTDASRRERATDELPQSAARAADRLRGLSCPIGAGLHRGGAAPHGENAVV